MLTPLQQSIAEAQDSLGNSEEGVLSELPETETDALRTLIQDRFFENGAATFQWEALKTPQHAIAFSKDPWMVIDRVIGPSGELLFFINETVNERTRHWCYRGDIAGIKHVIGEAIGLTEYCIVDPKLDWLVCLNHHDCLIAGGEYMTERLQAIEARVNPHLEARRIDPEEIT